MAVAARVDATARPVSDRREIASFLRTDRRYAAYALGDLDGPNRARYSADRGHEEEDFGHERGRMLRGSDPGSLPDAAPASACSFHHKR